MKKTALIGIAFLVLGAICYLLLKPHPIQKELSLTPTLPADATASSANDDPSSTPAFKFHNKANDETSGTPSQKLSRAELSNLANEVFGSMPTLESLRNLTPEEAHGVPQAIFAAGIELKRYADALDASMRSVPTDSSDFKDYASDAADAYGGCANTETTPDSLRAVCYVQFLKMAGTSGRGNMISSVNVTPEVVRLSRSLVH